jgi:beta-lactam-binding protein with PASTA domain/predicted Ser/Thr protein kinase
VRGSEPEGTLAGRYRLLDRVGEGGMGVVWRAHDQRLGRDVAVKLLRSFVAADPDQRRRFAREARTLASLANDHIVRVHDYADDGEHAFLVMEYVDGGNLAQTTFRRLPLDVGEAASYAAPVAAALAYAHGRGVVHRDLTPANILIERETGRVVTTDFGLARIARSSSSVTTIGMLIGTPEYWSPEQALGREAGTEADVYALGCILYLLVSGRLPFEGDDRLAVGLRRVHEQAPSLRRLLPGAAAELVDCLLARDPTGRPDAATAASALSALATPAIRDLQPFTVAFDAPTVVAPAEWPTDVLREPEREPEPPTVIRVDGERAAESPPPRTVVPPRRRRRRLLTFAVVTAVALVAGLVVAGFFQGSAARVPAVVSLQPAAARAQILETLPQATVSLRWAYSTRVAAGHVISQLPPARSRVDRETAVLLTVSKGPPFANVPAVSAGVSAAAARTTLARNGFHARIRYTPSWTVRKGAVIELRPPAGTRLHRPATVRVLVASGYPRRVVPNVVDLDLATAQARLDQDHFRYQVVYRLMPNASANQVVRQLPRAGAVVYRGTRVRLTVTRSYRWVTVFSKAGRGSYESDPFTVGHRWRIRYRLTPGSQFLPPLARLSWSRDGEPHAGDRFLATDTSSHTSVVDGSGTYRLSVEPYAGTDWSVQVEAYE